MAVFRVVFNVSRAARHVGLHYACCQLCFEKRVLIGAGSRDITSEDCLSESSSVTVANLTERIHRMEESHISTNEELEATVQVIYN